jgi:hypothetical protein
VCRCERPSSVNAGTNVHRVEATRTKRPCRKCIAGTESEDHTEDNGRSRPIEYRRVYVFCLYRDPDDSRLFVTTRSSDP